MHKAENKAEKSNDRASIPFIVFLNPNLDLDAATEQKLRSAGIRYTCLSSMLDVTDLLSRLPGGRRFIATINEDLEELDRTIGDVKDNFWATYVIILGNSGNYSPILAELLSSGNNN